MKTVATTRRSNTKATRIFARLRADVQCQVFGPSLVLPTETELCRRYSASRETIRKALRFLIAKGLAIRIPNRGVSLTARQRGVRRGEGLPITILAPHPISSMNYYYHGILSGLVAGSHEMGVSLAFIPRTPATDLFAVTADRAVILWPVTNEDLPIIYRMVQAERQFMVISASFEDRDLPCLDCDNAMGARQGIDYLVERGHRNIGLIARSPKLPIDHVQRIVSAKRRLRERGLPADALSVFLPEEAWSASDYNQAMRNWLTARRITAVFPMDLEIANRVYTFCESARCAIPGELSVISFDDSEWAEVYAPPVTTVAQPLLEIGVRALERLVAAVKNRQSCHGTELLPTRIVERESVVARQRTERAEAGRKDGARAAPAG